MDYTINKVSEGEISLLAEISRNTFLDAFGAVNKHSDMDLYITNQLNDQKIKEEWYHPDSIFYFLRAKEDIVGYLKLNIGSAQNEEVNNGLEIERIYIAKGFQSKGYGKILFDFAIQQAKVLNKAIIWLGVWEHNDGAIRFYERQGLCKFGSHTFMLGEDLQNDVLMKKVL